MKGLHQQIADKLSAIASDQELLDAGHLAPREEGEIRDRMTRLDREFQELQAAAIWGEEALAKIKAGLALLSNAGSGRSLSLSVTCFETGVWRLREHLGIEGN